MSIIYVLSLIMTIARFDQEIEYFWHRFTFLFSSKFRIVGQNIKLEYFLMALLHFLIFLTFMFLAGFWPGVNSWNEYLKSGPSSFYMAASSANHKLKSAHYAQ